MMTLYAPTSRLSLLPLQMSGLSMCVCVSRVFFLSKNKLLSSRPTHSVDEVDDDAFAPHLVIKSCAAASFMCLVQNILYSVTALRADFKRMFLHLEFSLHQRSCDMVLTIYKCVRDDIGKYYLQ
jgi:hypothetical protein